MTSDPSPDTLAILRVEAGPDAGREFDIQARTTTIGRATSSDVVLDDDSVSEKHARIDYDDGAWRLTDLGSTNGTRVDGERLPADVPTPLPHGTVLTLGGVRLHFRQEEADPEEAPEHSVKHAPSTEEEGGSASAKQRLKLPLWAVALVVVLLVIAILMLVAAAPATATLVFVEMETFLTLAAAGPPPLLP